MKQIDCLESRLLDVVAGLSDRTIVVIVSDHGSDFGSQVTRDPRSWSDSDMEERFQILVAMRSSTDCHPNEPVLLPNVFRSVFRCLGVSDLPDLEPRFFASSIYRGREAARPVMIELDSLVLTEADR